MSAANLFPLSTLSPIVKAYKNSSVHTYSAADDNDLTGRTENNQKKSTYLCTTSHFGHCVRATVYSGSISCLFSLEKVNNKINQNDSVFSIPRSNRFVCLLKGILCIGSRTSLETRQYHTTAPTSQSNANSGRELL